MADQKPLTETREFQDAVAKAAAIAAASAVEQMRAEIALSMKAGPISSDKSLMQELAMHIAQLTDQGTARKRVAPEILAERAAAHDRAVSLILAARKNGDQPEYALVAKQYLNERFIEPFTAGPDKRPIRTEIVWTGMPNEGMRPLNVVAKAIYQEFRASIGSSEKIAGLNNRPNYMTPAGLVVKGDPPKRRDTVAALPQFDDDLNVKTQFDPTAPEVHVLGTIAPPARQNTQMPRGGQSRQEGLI